MSGDTYHFVDSMAAYVAARLDVTTLVREFFPEYYPDGLVPCPFHSGGQERQASLHISPLGQAYCHACGWRASNVIELFAKLSELPYPEARKTLYARVSHLLPEARVEALVQVLKRKPRAWDYLQGKTRGLTLETIKKFRLGYELSSDRITIPIFDRFGGCTNLRRFAWDASKPRNRALNVRGYGEVRLFPENLFWDYDRLLLVEGEWDAMVGWQYGIPTVSWTGGASNWNHEYDWMFKNRYVFILYDNDVVGKAGAENALLNLKRISCHAEILPPPTFDHLKEGKDLTDWAIADPTWIHFLANDIALHQVSTRPEPNVCPYCGQVMPRKIQ